MAPVFSLRSMLRNLRGFRDRHSLTSADAPDDMSRFFDANRLLLNAAVMAILRRAQCSAVPQETVVGVPLAVPVPVFARPSALA